MTNSTARGRARVVRRASREGARRNVRPDAQIKNYTIKHHVDCEQTTNNKIYIIIAMLCTVCSTLITVKSTLDDLMNVKVVIFLNISATRYRNTRGAHFFNTKKKIFFFFY